MHQSAADPGVDVEMHQSGEQPKELGPLLVATEAGVAADAPDCTVQWGYDGLNLTLNFGGLLDGQSEKGGCCNALKDWFGGVAGPAEEFAKEAVEELQRLRAGCCDDSEAPYQKCMGTCLSSAGKRLGAELVQRAQDLFGFGATPEGGPRFGDQQLARQELNSEVCGLRCLPQKETWAQRFLLDEACPAVRAAEGEYASRTHAHLLVTIDAKNKTSRALAPDTCALDDTRLGHRLSAEFFNPGSAGCSVTYRGSVPKGGLGRALRSYPEARRTKADCEELCMQDSRCKSFKLLESKYGGGRAMDTKCELFAEYHYVDGKCTGRLLSSAGGSRHSTWKVYQ